MKTSKIQKSTTSNSHSSKPFFNKNEGGSFFSQTQESGTPFFSPSTIQTKLSVGQPNDKYEQEADKTAEKVVQKLENPSHSIPIQNKSEKSDQEDKLQMKEEGTQEIEILRKPIFDNNDDSQIQSKSIERRLNSTKGKGNSLTNDVRSNMESAFGSDFSSVKIHTDSDAIQMNSELGAKAFTNGSDIYFNAGNFQPASKEGKNLIAHELTHVVQQGKSTKSNLIQRQVSAASRSIANMSSEEKWEIVYGSAIQGARDGLVMALIIILGLIIVGAAAVAILTALAPEFVAALIAGVTSTTIFGASLGVWITATLSALGLAAGLTALGNEYRTVNLAVSNAQTVGDLENAGRDWGYNSGMALTEIFAIIIAHVSVRGLAGRFRRRLPGRRRTSRPSSPPRSQPTGSPSSSSQSARRLARQARERGEPVVANMGGAGGSHEPPGAININNQAVPRSGIPNLIEEDASIIGQLFEAGSVDRVVGHHMAPGVIDWQRAVSGIRRVLRSGGEFRYDWRGATPEAETVVRILREAGFENIVNMRNAVVTAIRP